MLIKTTIISGRQRKDIFLIIPEEAKVNQTRKEKEENARVLILNILREEMKGWNLSSFNIIEDEHIFNVEKEKAKKEKKGK